MITEVSLLSGDRRFIVIDCPNALEPAMEAGVGEAKGHPASTRKQID
jgi:hypothetical protein